MLAIAEIARRDGVSKPAVSRKVKQLVAEHGLTVERDARGRVASVHVAEYDHLRNRTDDPSKRQAPRRLGEQQDQPAPPIQPDESYDEALRQKTWVEAERAKLRLAAERGEYVPVKSLVEALVTASEEIVRAIDRLGSSVDDMAAAVARDGAHGLRTEVKKIVFRMKGDVSKALEAVAAGTPEDASESEI